ncbi:mannitol dehydrogenase family protein [Colwellia sp. UCD-KL20]|uniref:mannitol dehydrogenase family protein n=1 Tax=Colwellia sp. UCD-KL20 TaxID=1917165 RepID=UPI0009704864|nr:mannitol dehydrogenase family protein [Colwellia sp. UCD-KL20]
MKLLCDKSLHELANKGVDVPTYRSEHHKPEIGIVHIGPGAFFRGHQAWYTHQALQSQGGDWSICAVSMRSTGVSDALTPQNGLYSLAQLDNKNSYQVVGSITEVLIATQQYKAVIERLSTSNTKFVTLTITEKGYCLNNEGHLDLTHSEIIQDLATAKESNSAQAITAVGILTNALAIRKAKGLAPFCIVSCDNITDNGKKLRAAVIQFAQAFDNDLADWLSKYLICPCTMVDSITPATDDSLRELIEEEFSIKDNWPIKRESFLQWIIEDCLPEDRPAWEEAGAVLTSDVEGFENAKLRLLNCPHSTLAYIGVLLGCETVFDAMQKPNLVAFIEKMVDEEIIPSFISPKELDAKAYSNEILERFRNPAIRHLLAQIAWDGSQKLPMRILPIIEQNLNDKRSIASLSGAIVAWFLFLRKRYIEKEELVDPLSDNLLKKVSLCNNDIEHDIQILCSIEQVFKPELAQNQHFIKSLQNKYKLMLPLLSEGDSTEVVFV